jgi:hypothetical protein
VRLAFTLAWLARIIPSNLADQRLVQNAYPWLALVRRHLARHMQ